MPDIRFTLVLPDVRSAHPADLLRYIAEDSAAIRYRMETGKYPPGVTYDESPATLIAAYAEELKRRGY